MIVKNKYSMHGEFSEARSGRTVRGISRSALAIAVSGVLLAGLGGCAVVTDILLAPLARDRGARASSTVVRLDRVYAEEPDGGEPNLIFRFSSTSTFVATDAQIVALVLAADPVQSADALRASNPEFFDGAENSFLTMTGNTVLGFGLDSNEQIIGTNSNIQLYTDQGLDVIA